MELVWRNILIFIFLHYASVAVFFLPGIKFTTVAIGAFKVKFKKFND